MTKEKILFDETAKLATHNDVARLFKAKAEEIKTAENISYEFDRIKWDGMAIADKIVTHGKELYRLFSENTLSDYLSFAYGDVVDSGYSISFLAILETMEYLEDCTRNLKLFLDGKKWDSEILKFKYESHS